MNRLVYCNGNLKMKSIFDPSFLFSFGVCLTPIMLVLLEDSEKDFWTVPVQHLRNGPFLAAMFTWAVLEWIAWFKSQPLTPKQHFVSRWYLNNGIFIHALLDACR